MKLIKGALVALALAAGLGGCAQTFKTDYAQGVDPQVSRGWRLAKVEVTVPPTLTVSEDNVLVPEADIVWQVPPMGDRRAQVGAIMTEAVTAGASGLHGARRVNILVTLRRFHALTPAAEALRMQNVGVLNVDFTISVVDAATGAVLAGPEAIEGALPGLTGQSAVQAHAEGRTQKTEIEAHVRAVVAGWLGIGPDARGSFSRIGA